jgi:hypothetical protein
MKWISVKDRLPQEGYYLIAVKQSNEYVVLQCEYTTEIFSNSNSLMWINQECHSDKWNPTHWMELPEPPKENQHFEKCIPRISSDDKHLPYICVENCPLRSSK